MEPAPPEEFLTRPLIGLKEAQPASFAATSGANLHPGEWVVRLRLARRRQTRSPFRRRRTAAQKWCRKALKKLNSRPKVAPHWSRCRESSLPPKPSLSRRQ